MDAYLNVILPDAERGEGENAVVLVVNPDGTAIAIVYQKTDLRMTVAHVESEEDQKQLLERIERTGLPETSPTESVQIFGPTAVILRTIHEECSADPTADYELPGPSMYLLSGPVGYNQIELFCLAYTDEHGKPHFHLITEAETAVDRVRHVPGISATDRKAMLHILEGQNLPTTSEIPEVHLVDFAALYYIAAMYEDPQEEIEEEAEETVEDDESVDMSLN